MKSVIFTLAKYESQYIEDFVVYHLGIGFSHIYIYDNEDIPTYSNLLYKYVVELHVILPPGFILVLLLPPTPTFFLYKKPYCPNQNWPLELEPVPKADIYIN